MVLMCPYSKLRGNIFTLTAEELKTKADNAKLKTKANNAKLKT